MFHDCRYKPTNQIKMKAKNKIENKRENLIKNIIDIKTLILSHSKAKDTPINPF